MNTWFPQITAVFTDRKTVIQHKGERLSRFYKCASSLVSIQVSFCYDGSVPRSAERYPAAPSPIQNNNKL